VAIGLTAVAVGLAGCGDDRALPDRPSTTSAGNRGAIERRLVRYFERNFKTVRWYRDVRRFEIRGGRLFPGFEEVEDATVVVHTRLDAQARRAGREICAGVFGADVADVGGTVRVLGEGDAPVAECRSDR
jgi:hypothetical protein